MEVRGVAAMVTGAASGLGAVTAAALAQAGAKVALLDVNEDGAKAAAREIGGIGLRCDVTNDESATRAVQAATKEHGAARILVNCAGIAPGKRIVGRDGPMPLADFRRAIDINLIGTFNMMRLVAADLTKLDPLGDSERGVIISTASIAAFEGQIGQTAYAASKGGVAALTLPAARELAQFGIRVMAIAPGIFGTPMLRGLPDEVQESLAASVPYPARLGEPAEFADLVLTIVRNRYLNGEMVRLDGALRMAPR